MTRLAVFTTGSRNRMAMARALMATLRRHHPEADQFICIGDDPAGVVPPPDCRILAGAEIGVPGWRNACFAYDAMALNCLLKPFTFLHLVETLGYDRVLHFDTDMALYAPLHSVAAALDAGASLVLTPHLLAAPEPGDIPDPLGILMAGTYNTGFVAAGSSQAARAALRWWAARLHTTAGVAPERGLVWDQRWMDLAPGLFADVHILRDPAVNVAYWNLPQRRLSRGGARWTVAGQPLALFHFSGFDPATPTRLTRHASSLPTPPAPELAALLAEYAAPLAAHRHPADDAQPYAYARFASGTPIPSTVRTLFHAHHRDWPTDPFETFEAHLDTIAPGLAASGPGAVAAEPVNAAIHELAAVRELASIRRSVSWRLTAPLRAIAARFRRRR